MIDTIIFDAEGIIINTEVLWDKSQEIFLKKRGLEYNREFLKPKMAGKSLKDGVEILKQYCGIDGDTESLAMEREEITRHLFATEIGFIDGFIEFFKELKKKKFKYCIATSMEKTLMTLAEQKLKLSEMFDKKIFFISDVSNKSKPDPAIFLYACQRLNSQPEKCLVIEDSVNGVTAAKRANMKCVAITSTFPKGLLNMANKIVDHFSDIDLDNIDQWLG